MLEDMTEIQQSSKALEIRGSKTGLREECAYIATPPPFLTVFTKKHVTGKREFRGTYFRGQPGFTNADYADGKKDKKERCSILGRRLLMLTDKI